MHKTRASGHYDREITTTSRQGKPLRGRMSVHDGAVRVTTPDGRWNATQVGGSPPQALARNADLAADVWTTVRGLSSCASNRRMPCGT
jgi:hypothetical protein